MIISWHRSEHAANVSGQQNVLDQSCFNGYERVHLTGFGLAVSRIKSFIGIENVSGPGTGPCGTRISLN